MDHILLINMLYVHTGADYIFDYALHFSSVIRNPLVCIVYHYGGFNSIELFLHDCDQFIGKIKLYGCLVAKRDKITVMHSKKWFLT